MIFILSWFHSYAYDLSKDLYNDAITYLENEGYNINASNGFISWKEEEQSFHLYFTKITEEKSMMTIISNTNIIIMGKMDQKDLIMFTYHINQARSFVKAFFSRYALCGDMSLFEENDVDYDDIYSANLELYIEQLILDSNSLSQILSFFIDKSRKDGIAIKTNIESRQKH